MKEVRCTKCEHLKVAHFTKNGCLKRGGCTHCGCRCREEIDFEEVEFHRYRVHNEWTYEAKDEHSALEMFADDSYGFAEDADIEELADDDGRIASPDNEWQRIVTDDIQQEAENRLGRLLTDDELECVKRTFSHS